jgi:exopolyphosphatase/guanosine-5'-triphosphate,3'-diphosphate pyrophosphatase
MKKVVAIDLGSNSIRFLKIDCETKKFLSQFHKTVKTADNLAITGEISQGALKRVVEAINEAKEKMDFSDAKIKAVTTEALRQAINSKEILDRIERETAVRFDVIDGDDEAKYALTATENRLELLGLKPKSFLLADIGGASTEIIINYEDKIFSKSFSIGIVTLTQSFGTLREIAGGIPSLMNEIRLFVEDIYSKYGRVEKFIAIAGTPTTIASMKLGLSYNTYDAEKIHGTVLSRTDLVHQLERLLTMPKEERVKIVGVGREDLIASGVLIYEEIYNIGRFNESIVIDDGVREGVAFSECTTLNRE